MTLPTAELHRGDCLAVLPALASGSVDAVVTDPPYPGIDRPYGRQTEAEWWSLIVEGVIPQVRRILKPTGSVVFILQPNSRQVGSMRGWLFEFQAWACREWNMVQDVWWWNFTAPPTVHCHRKVGLMRPSLKACVWLGPADCHRHQESVLWTQSESNAAKKRSNRALSYSPSGLSMRSGRSCAVADERGGTTPFNVIPAANTTVQESTGAGGHPARTPAVIADWWTRYLCPPGGTVCDPFMGSGTVGLSAIKYGHNFVGVELDPAYFTVAERRIGAARLDAHACPLAKALPVRP